MVTFYYTKKGATNELVAPFLFVLWKLTQP